jgi:O-antigen/teichoic acid export membrane protein
VNATLAQPTASPVHSLHSIVSGTRLLALSQIIRRVLRMSVLLLAARMLGVETFGSYVLLLTVVEMVALISGYGYMDFLTREIAQHPNSAWTLGKRVTELRLLLIAPSLGLALLIMSGLHFSSSLVINAAWLGISLLPRAITESGQGMMKGVSRFAPLPWIDFAQGAMVLSSAAIFIFFGLGIRGMIVAEIVGSFAAAGISFAVVARWVAIGSSDTPDRRSLLRSAFPFNIYPFLTNIYDRVDVVLLSKLAGNFATGIYSLPYRAFAALQIVPYAIMGALLPVLSGQTQRDAIETCARAMKVLLPAALLLVLVTLSFAGPAVRLFLGPSYAGCVLTVQVLIWAVVPAFINFALNTLLVAEGKERIFLRTTVVCMVFNIAANLLLIPRYSYIAAAGVTIATECVLLAQNLFYVRRIAGRALASANPLKTSVVFVAVLAALWTLSRAIPPMLAGSLATVAFLAFALSNAGLTGRVFASGAPEHNP